jgi:recombinational DNA repair ATPase RecF
MKIVSLKVENVKRVESVFIKPEGNTVVIAGKNESGKSSILDAMLIGMVGNKAMPSMPVREGADKGLVEIDLGELTIHRTITPSGGGTLTVRGKDGAKFNTPQKILDELYGRLTFDPEQFRKQKPIDRVETLRQLLGLDFSAEDGQIDHYYSERTIINREVGQLEARIQAAPVYPEVTTDEEVTKDFIIGAQQKSIEKNQQNFHVRRAAQDSVNGFREAEAKVIEVQKEVDSLKGLLEISERKLEGWKNTVIERHAEAADWRDKANALVDDDMQEYSKMLSTADDVNAKIRANREHLKLRTDLLLKQTESHEFTKLLDDLAQEKRDRLAKAKYPIKGLVLTDTNMVQFNSIPFDQCSTAQQLKISVAMGIAMNPRLRVLVIRQGNDLDVDNLRIIGEMADEHDMQIWIERVSTDGDVAVIIEDGHVKAPAAESRLEFENKLVKSGALP